MTSLISVSQNELNNRRKQLRQKRRVRSVQSIWRNLALAGLTTGIAYICTLPDWVISRPEQIIIEGDKLLPQKNIRKIIPISYPQAIFKLEPTKIVAKLEQDPSIAKVIVNRQLLPPGLIISIQERQPVAIAINPQTSTQGYIDETGVWIPQKTYSHIAPEQLPKLKVIGNLQQYSNFWQQMYKIVSVSPMKISEIDCQNPANIILKTELGIVHLGSYSRRLADQLIALDKMRELPQHLQLNDIVYIDLKNPDTPSIKIAKSNETKDTIKPENEQKP